MSPEAQRIAIAESLGYINVRRWSESCIASMGITAEGKYWGSLAIPDYLNDLNAMQSAEKDVFRGSNLWQKFVFELIKTSGRSGMIELDGLCCLVQATAKQRAEAYLRTIGKWEGGSDES